MISQQMVTGLENKSISYKTGDSQAFSIGYTQQQQQQQKERRGWGVAV